MRGWRRHILWFLLTGLAFSAGEWLESHPRSLAQKVGVEAFDDMLEVSSRFALANASMWVVDAGPAGLFTAASLRELQMQTRSLVRSRQCRSVVGVTELLDPLVGEETTEVVPLIDHIPDDPQALAALAQKVLSRREVADQLVSSNGRYALVLCLLADPFVAGPDEPSWLPAAPKHTSWTRVDMRATALALARDLQLFAVLMLCVALPVMWIFGWCERRYGRRFVVWALLCLCAVSVLASVVGWRSVLMARDGVSSLLGGRAYEAAQKLDAVTHSTNTAFVTAEGDFGTAEGLRRLDETCRQLGTVAPVSCPTEALRLAASALTGTPELPTTDEQAKQLWFLLGDRAELSLLFTSDKQAALIRLRGKLATLPVSTALPVRLASLYAMSRALRTVLATMLLHSVVLAAVFTWLAKRGQRHGLPMACALLVSAFACPVAALSLLLLTLSAWTVFGSLARVRVGMKDLE